MRSPHWDIWPDHDEPGRDHAGKLAEDLVSILNATPLILPISDTLVKGKTPALHRRECSSARPARVGRISSAPSTLAASADGKIWDTAMFQT